MTSFNGLRALAVDLRCQYRRDGLRPFFERLRKRVRLGLSSEEELIVMRKDLDSIATPQADGDLRLEELRPGHLQALSEMNRKRCNTRADRRFAEDVARGYRGFVAFRDAELVGYYWWVDRDHSPQHRDLDQLGLAIPLETGDVYGSDFFILEEHRGAGTSNDFLAKLETALGERSYRRLWGYVAGSNRPAHWLYRARGYEPMYRITRRTRLLRRTSTAAEAEAKG
jgi:GNAT superfamily N-acetyltransferase